MSPPPNNYWTYGIFIFIISTILIIAVYYLTRKTYQDTFIDRILEEKANYIKYSETLVNGAQKLSTSPMSLAQCQDQCTNDKTCIGFTRPIINDDEKGECHFHLKPENLNQCHSNRKGTLDQQSVAMQYNTWIKDTVPYQHVKCIGDEAATLNRDVFLKSLSDPKRYLGYHNNTVKLLHRDPQPSVTSNKTRPYNFYDACRWRFIIGLEGRGTLSLLHVLSGKILTRLPNSSELVDAKELTSAAPTKDRIRASFILLDGENSGVVLMASNTDGEVEPRYLMAKPNTDGELHISSSLTDKISTTFIIQDTINNRVIVSPKQIKEEYNGDLTAQPMVVNSGGDDDATRLTKIYQGGKNKSEMHGWYNNTYNKESTVGMNGIKEDILKEIDRIKAADQMNTSLEDNKQRLDTYKNINMKFEDVLNERADKLDKQYNNVIHDLDNIRISSMASDYYYLKNLTE